MDVTISARFSGRAYNLNMRIYTRDANAGGNWSAYHGDRWVSPAGGSGSYDLTCYTVNSWIAGNYAGGCYPLDMRSGNNYSFGSYDTGAVGHDGNGGLYFTSRINRSGGLFGTADTGDVGMYGDRLPLAPGAPGQPTISNSTPTAVTLSWTGASRGHADISQYQWQMSVDPNFGSQVAAPQVGNVLTSNTSGYVTLTPGTTYYVRVRAYNSDGWGGWSGVQSFVTLPADPPGISVNPAVSGQSATVSLTAPGGTSGVTKYTVERRIGTGAATSVETATSPLTVSGLTPGTTYQWRASAWYGSYQSPWSAWQNVTQPNPSVSAGDYFDGASPAKGDITYSWTGTANLSTSQAKAPGVKGWYTALGAGMGNAKAVLQRLTGGRSGTYCARTIITNDAPAAGVYTGLNFTDATARAAVAAGGAYVASLYVRPGRAQRLVAQIVWTDSSGTPINPQVDGVAQVVTDTTGWTRLTASGTAPANAAYATVRVHDAAGTGWSAWLSGEFYDVDDAMISLGDFPWFSGDTVDTADWIYDWTGAANSSASTRTANTVTVVDPLADPDCPAPPPAPRPPVPADDCIDEVGTWRRYWAAIDQSLVTTWVAAVPTLRITTGALPARQVRIRVFENPDAIPPSSFDGSAGWDSEQIISYIPANTTILIDGVSQRCRASVAGGDWIAADRLLYGTGGAPATWPLLRCGVGYLFAFDAPTDAPAENLILSAALTRRY